MQRKALVVFMFSVVVLASKFLFGWDTAWTVGSCFVALVTLFFWENYNHDLVPSGSLSEASLGQAH
jgi:hypothetical protein